MPPKADAKARRRRYWLTWWFWPWLLLLGRDRRSDWPAISNSAQTAWWARLGLVFIVVALVAWATLPEDNQPVAKAMLGVSAVFGLLVLITGQVHVARQRREWLAHLDDGGASGRSQAGVTAPRPSPWLAWVAFCSGLVIVPLTRGDRQFYREWYRWQVAWSALGVLAVLGVVVLAALGPYWFPAVEAVHRALAWLLGRDPAKAQELMLPSLLIVFGVPVALIAGLVWQLRRRARYRANEEYLEQIRQQGRDE